VANPLMCPSLIVIENDEQITWIWWQRNQPSLTQSRLFRVTVACIVVSETVPLNESVYVPSRLDWLWPVKFQ